MYAFPMGEPPEELRATSYGVAAERTTVTFTFAGDCTLGGETSARDSRNSFASRVKANGTAYPFTGLQELFGTDDFTVVNLEGVLSDGDEGRVGKQFNFLGDPAYTGILTDGSVECANLANNHSLDYGRRGYEDTLEALRAADIGYFDEDTLLVVEKDGVRVGLTATLFTLGGQKRERLARQIELLRELGCAAVIHSMHAGTEYAAGESAGQRSAARAAAELGAALVVGHHPHVVQGAALTEGIPVLYSLGNCSFGGNVDPRDYDAALLRAELTFEDGALCSLDWTIWPISQSGEKGRNNYQPALLGGKDAERVMNKIQNASDIALAPFQEGLGARQETVYYER